MTKPVLYIFIGYPGAGKTTIARLISEKTGAVHVWADLERRKRFGTPTHSHDESKDLYDQLNEQTSQLLKQGKSVLFDTNFNFYDDRQRLRDIAAENNALCVTLWIATSLVVSRARAVHSMQTRNGYETAMTEEQFNDIVYKLQPPDESEKVIKIDGAKLDEADLLPQLEQVWRTIQNDDPIS